MAADTLPAKWFCIGKSGNTIDGRIIEPQWLIDAATLYDPNEYTARINVEHFLSVVPNSDFQAYGDVLSLESVEAADGDFNPKR